MISPFILRRTKQEVLLEIPSLTIEDIECPLTEMQEALYYYKWNVYSIELMFIGNGIFKQIQILLKLFKIFLQLILILLLLHVLKNYHSLKLYFLLYLLILVLVSLLYWNSSLNVFCKLVNIKWIVHLQKQYQRL